MTFYLNGSKMSPVVFTWLVLVIAFCVYSVIKERSVLKFNASIIGPVLEDVYVSVDKDFAYIQVKALPDGIAIKELLKYKYFTVGLDDVVVIKIPRGRWDLSMGYFDLFSFDNGASLDIQRVAEVDYITFLQHIRRASMAINIGGLTIYDYMVVLSFVFFVFVSLLRGHIGKPMLIMFAYWGVSGYFSEIIPHSLTNFIHHAMISNYFT